MTAGGPYSDVNISPVLTTSYTDTTVLAGDKYFYVVTAVDAEGGVSLPSNEVSATIPSATPPPPVALYSWILSPVTMGFTSTGTNPATQNLTVDDNSPTAQSFSLRVDAPWLSVNTSKLTTKSTVVVAVNASSANAGNNIGHISIVPAANSGLPTGTVTVTLALTKPVPVPMISFTCPTKTTTSTSETVTCVLGGFLPGQTGVLTWQSSGAPALTISVTHP